MIFIYENDKWLTSCKSRDVKIVKCFYRPAFSGNLWKDHLLTKLPTFDSIDTCTAFLMVALITMLFEPLGSKSFRKIHLFVVPLNAPCCECRPLHIWRFSATLLLTVNLSCKYFALNVKFCEIIQQFKLIVSCILYSYIIL